jgi:hypothetical protein
MMTGGNIFNFSFKLPGGSFIFAIFIMIIIGLFLAIGFGIIYLGLWAIDINPVVYSVVGIVYLVLALYAPLDYIYTMGIEDAKSGKV